VVVVHLSVTLDGRSGEREREKSDPKILLEEFLGFAHLQIYTAPDSLSALVYSSSRYANLFRVES